jgi:hypothetical protein
MDDEIEAPVDLDKLAYIYIKIRDARDDTRRIFMAKEKELEDQMQTLSEQMLDSCKEMGADSIRTAHGTIIRTVKSRYTTNDWDSMYSFIQEHGAFGLLEKRLQQTNMKEFLSENPDLLPMGLNVQSEYTVSVRRSKDK